jgi:hypothetical protein
LNQIRFDDFFNQIFFLINSIGNCPQPVQALKLRIFS